MVETRNTRNINLGNNRHMKSLVRFEVLMAVIMSTFLVFGFFDTEDGESIFLRNVGLYLAVYVTSQRAEEITWLT